MALAVSYGRVNDVRAHIVWETVRRRETCMRIRAKSMAFGRMLVFLLMVLSAITGILGSTFAASAVGPACTLNPTSGVVGTTITVSCTGFTAGETVQVWWDGVNSTIMAYASFTADTNGAGSASFKAPSTAGGTHTVIARGGV